MRLAFLVNVTVGLALAGGTVSAQEFLAPRPAPLASPFVGAGSCSASACHANPVHGQTGSEFSTWATSDPHAKAYEVLFDARSVRIQKNLGTSTKAHEDRRCLKCHVGPEFDDHVEKQVPYFRTDGVSCETCHGAAGPWLTTHYATSWREKTPAQKRSAGMKDTHSILGRARLCATCHVGAPEMEVDHDLIAAGHPRLNFEFAAFHAALPRHWSDAGQRDFEYRAWQTGQLVTAQAGLALLADRAADERKPWPEFAEHDCAACHHNLHAINPRPQRPGKLGLVPWSAWNLAMTPSDAVADLRSEMAKGWQNRKAIAFQAKLASQRLTPTLERVDSPNAADAVLREILARDRRHAGQGWDETAQLALALAALRPHASDARTLGAIQDFARSLKLPGNYDNPDSIDPRAVRQRLIEFKRKEGR